MNITEALKKLDPKEDSHWNKDGAPNMAAVEALVGDRTIKREQVTDAAPLFSRGNLEFPLTDEEKAELEKAEDGKEEKTDASEEDEETKPEEDENPVVVIEEEDKVKAAEKAHDKECEKLEEKIKDTSDAISELEGKKFKIEKKMKELSNLKDSLINKLPPIHVNNGQQAIVDHIRKQNERTMEKYERFGREGTKTALDRAMAPNKGRNKRPTFSGNK